MFKMIRDSWRIARGDVLKRDFEDANLRLLGLGEDVNIRALVTLASSHLTFVTNYKALSNVSDSDKRKLAKEISRVARESYKIDMGHGYGLAMFSLWLESAALPGENAAYVHLKTDEMMKVALQTYENLDDELR